MIILATNTRVKFGNRNEKTGTIVGHCTMMRPTGTTILAYAILLDEEWQGYINHDSGKGSYVSTLLVNAESVTKIG
jgi:hypothetical protein